MILGKAKALLYIGALTTAFGAGWMVRGWYEDSQALDHSEEVHEEAADTAKDVSTIDSQTLTEDQRLVAEGQAREEEIRNAFSERREGRSPDAADSPVLIDPFDSAYYRMLRENRQGADPRAPGDVSPRE